MRVRVQQFGRAIRRSLVSASAAVLLALVPIATHADNYGSGVYSNDVYNSSSTSSGGGGSSGTGSSGSSSSGSSGSAASSSSSAEPTVIETESGMQVAINLSDGQVIPSSGYYITITPLNGQGKSFDKAEIYLDGTLVYSGAPDSTGTLKWLWDTAKSPATKVKIVVYGPGAGTTTHEFNVTIGQEEAANNTESPSTTSAETASSPDTNAGWPLWVIITAGVIGLLVIFLILWLLLRRRRNQNQVPPSTFTPLQ